MKDLVLFGTGGFAREVHQIVEDINQDRQAWNFLGFLDMDPQKHNMEIHGHTVLGGAEWLATRPHVAAAIAIGSPAAKRKIYKLVTSTCPGEFATLIHPLAWKGNRVSIGEGTIVCAGVSITTDISIGDHVILNLGCTVGHDTVIESYVTVAPGVNISGNVRIEEGCDLGTNSSIIQNIAIGPWSVIGAGAVVVHDVPSNVTSVGIPATTVKERPEGWHET